MAVVALSTVILAAVATTVVVALAPSSATSLSGAAQAEPAKSARAATPLLSPTPLAASTPSPPPAPAVCAATAPGVKEIYVSISRQHLWACTGNVLLVEGAVTTGASALTNVHDATPVGLSRINAKIRKTVLSGHDVNGSWNDPVTYWMPFKGGDGFHDAPWQTFPLGSPLYTTQGSHGCVHVSLDVLAEVFNWAEVGTLVNVQA
ncbi:MAG: L,D-transpeptidase [Actinomycetota bacterium]|nr:L,D-transpeptidase [Actinomycetota bacterium]